jgi:hypothetical protein
MSTRDRAKQLEARRMRRAAAEVMSTWPIRRWLLEYADLLDPSEPEVGQPVVSDKEQP